jgi:bacterioferritin
MDTRKAIELLNQDLQDEHAAIVQYLTHAYAFGEGELAGELESIAREEMQHFRWLAEKITELGGTPSMKRGAVIFDGPRIAGMLQEDVDAEARAIAQYREHIAAIGDPDVTRLLERIIADEVAHQADFEHFVEKQDPGEEIRIESTLAEEDRPVAGFLQKDVTHEYTVVLQYLAHSFMTPHCEVEHELEWQAIEEMRHLGWLAEEMEELGTRAEMTHDPLVLPAKTTEMLEADIAVEQAVIEAYRQQASDVGDPEFATLFNRIAGEEDHHVYIFGELLDIARAAEAPPPVADTPALTGQKPPADDRPRFTVGSLMED